MTLAADKLSQPGLTLSAFVPDWLADTQLDKIRHALLEEGIFLGFTIHLRRRAGLTLSAGHELLLVPGARAALQDRPGFGEEGTLNAFRLELDQLIHRALPAQT